MLKSFDKKSRILEEHRRDAGKRPRDYARKPAIKNEDVTWSQEEYADLGLIFEYCRYKSIQRLTEAWSTFEKAKKKRLFEFVDRKVQLMDERREKPRETNEYDTDAVFDATKEDEDEGDNVFLRVASLGGGPGFELLAFKWFIEYAFRATTTPRNTATWS